MSDSHEDTYLQQVLALDPRTEPDVILRRRREFLQPADVILAEFADDGTDSSDLRTQMQHRLNAVRQGFWSLDADELARQLSFLHGVAHAETVTAATRLQQVAQRRAAIQRLLADPNVHPAFVNAFAEILIAPVAEANRLREREHRWMRPEQNQHYEAARRAVQGTAHVIRSNYPEVYQLEEAWLTELLEYNPVEETEHESANTLFGLAMLMAIGMTLFTIVSVVRWIFR